ncbi:hypothetical protein [Robertmurraya kyonggiensis]|uniref:Uncharacterized protein n=1 Tax=Robertmurraya kyonggiensis TaxID=1037680 RepID=A0A4U1CXN1_9BACI|nr:hypothetical protein [Robertmurraya kyonggiensis]TKC14367.1 hypothetical protein FA727_21645 [Robertmurraya kyonggiensis]
MSNRTNMTPVGKKRGPKVKVSDEQMKELALKVKKKYKQQQLTYLMLEKDTGIGRNTWKRRIEDFIHELNRPILRDFGYTDSDEIYFPNIESIFEAYGDDTQKIINELHHFELLFQELYEERTNLKEKLARLESFKDKIEEYTMAISNLQKEVKHYKTLYEQIVVSSTETHLRDEIGLKDNLLDFNTNFNKNISLNNLQHHFPEILEDVVDNDETIRVKNMEKLKNQFNNLFKE